jgi:5-methylcytosine-specific restriction endonuclease McrA
MDCHYCGETFTVDNYRGGPARKYCGSQCARQANRDRRRAKVLGLPNERIDKHLVFERDNYICGICHGMVDRTLTWPSPLSASLDHIIPIVRGGTHTYDNVQCSHLRCNVLKRDS